MLTLILFPLLISFASFKQILAARNVTIDDTYGDQDIPYQTRIAGDGLPLYFPPRLRWMSSCKGCNPHPGEANAYNGTWTAALIKEGLMESASVGELTLSDRVYMRLTFHGTAIYVYFLRSPFAALNADIYLDGDRVGTFDYPQVASYNWMTVQAIDPTNPKKVAFQAVFSMEGLENKSHDLSVQPGSLFTGYNWFAFDYALYTKTTPIYETERKKLPDIIRPPNASYKETVPSPVFPTGQRSLSGDLKFGCWKPRSRLEYHAVIGLGIIAVLLALSD